MKKSVKINQRLQENIVRMLKEDYEDNLIDNDYDDESNDYDDESNDYDDENNEDNYIENRCTTTLSYSEAVEIMKDLKLKTPEDAAEKYFKEIFSDELEFEETHKSPHEKYVKSIKDKNNEDIIDIYYDTINEEYFIEDLNFYKNYDNTNY